MTAKAHQLSIGIGITYLLYKLHSVWWKTELALNFRSFNLLRAYVYPQCIGPEISWCTSIHLESYQHKINSLIYSFRSAFLGDQTNFLCLLLEETSVDETVKYISKETWSKLGMYGKSLEM